MSLILVNILSSQAADIILKLYILFCAQNFEYKVKNYTCLARLCFGSLSQISDYARKKQLLNGAGE